MTGQVIADSRFLNPEALLQLRQGGAEVNIASILSGLKHPLPEPDYGERTLGMLTVDEAILFKDMLEAHDELQTEAKAAVADMMMEASTFIRAADATASVEKVFGNFSGSSSITDERKEKLHRLRQRHQMLHAAFFFHVGERFSHHRFRLGVRSGGKVVVIEEK